MHMLPGDDMKKAAIAASLLLLFVSLPRAQQSAPVRGAIPFEQAIDDLGSSDSRIRLRAVRMLKDAAYPESAVPLAKIVTDPHDELQFEAIAAELNIFLAEPIVTRKRVGFVVELRKAVLAEPLFAAGPSVLGSRPVPLEVLTALRAAIRDENPRVGLEALYAFGVLGAQPVGAQRAELLSASGPDLAGLVGSRDPAFRYAAVRVLERVYSKRPDDRPIEQAAGDALVAALNDREKPIKIAATETLGVVGCERATPALTEQFRYYRKGDLALASLDALARLAQPSSEALFAEQLSSKTAAIRGVAIEGLARLRDKARLTEIQSALAAERSDAVQLAGAFALAMLSDASLDRIAEALVVPRSREQARQYLIDLAPGRLTALTRYLQDPDSRIREDVIDAIALSGDAGGRPLLEPLVNDHDPLVARAAERALTQLRP
jgi:HEAT repeat protein